LTAAVITHWMETLESLIKQYNFPASLILNFDETMLDPTHPKLKIISRSGNPRLFVATAEKGEHISLGLCVAAAGASIHPLVILPLKLAPLLSAELSHFYAISGSDTGFITKEIWFNYLAENLIPQVNQIRQWIGDLEV
jgi:hypothetical protein